jgi:protein O-GlcNAc transferase
LKPFMATVAEALMRAQRHLQGGELQQAENIYRQVLQTEPLQSEALHFLGVIALQVGKNDLAVSLMEQSIAIAPGIAGFHYNLGSARQSQGELERAVVHYREAIRLQPDIVDAHNNLGDALADLGRLEEAVASHQRALALKPSLAAAHYSLANTLKKLGKLDAAAASYRQALRFNPGHAHAHNNLGVVLKKLGRLDEAAASYQRALLLKPDFDRAHSNLGNILQEQGNLDQAAAHYRQALACNPQLGTGHLNLGNLLRTQGKFEDAAAHARQAVQLQPDLIEAHLLFGKVLQEQGRAEEAVLAYRQALRLEPDSAEPYDLGDGESKTGESMAHFQETLGVRPSARLRIALATRQPVIYQSVAELESWRGRLIEEVRLLREQEVVHDVNDEAAVNVFYLAYQGVNDRDIQRDVARLHKAPMFEVRGSRWNVPGQRKIRVGFLSSFFRRHTIGFLIGGLVKQLSREDLEVVVLSVGRHKDEVTVFFKQHADQFVEIPRHLPTARRIIGEQSLDVLFYTDIGMDPETSTLAHSRLAPVQCTTWGHPVTTGIDAIDYFISSEALETEEAEQHYTEKLVKLKNLPTFYYRPELPGPAKAREDFGLTSDSHVYACPQNLIKLHPDFDEVAGGILRGDPRGVLVLGWGLAPQWKELLRRRFAATLPDVVERIRFLPRLNRPEFLNFMAVSDVLLDPIHFGGGNTSYEGLALGAPIVTLPSRFLRGRITFALYKQMGMLDCVVHSPQEYVELALRLGTDKSYRDQVRDRILEGNGVLYQNSAGVKELEEFFKDGQHLTHPRERER